jgi:NADPH-dependent 2,4-dienoyl-CoA reductase/sulfur reductase-like enzyme
LLWKGFLTGKRNNHICITGGGFIGLETAEQLRNLGDNITILEHASVFLPIDLDIAESLRLEIRKHGVKLQLDATVKRIEATHVVLENGSQMEADMILVLVAVRARTELARKAGLLVGKAGVTVNEFMQTYLCCWRQGRDRESHHLQSDAARARGSCKSTGPFGGGSYLWQGYSIPG